MTVPFLDLRAAYLEPISTPVRPGRTEVRPTGRRWSLSGQDALLKVANLSKYYRLGLIGGGTPREDLNRWWAKARGRPDPLLRIGDTDHGNRVGGDLWALRDVSFEVRKGEILGIIGRNGAGKSTLFKILSRITAPTSGEVRIKGPVGSLLEAGAGVHPELTNLLGARISIPRVLSSGIKPVFLAFPSRDPLCQ